MCSVGCENATEFSAVVARLPAGAKASLAAAATAAGMGAPCPSRQQRGGGASPTVPPSRLAAAFFAAGLLAGLLAAGLQLVFANAGELLADDRRPSASGDLPASEPPEVSEPQERSPQHEGRLPSSPPPNNLRGRARTERVRTRLNCCELRTGSALQRFAS
jgi:hypothetical protein